MFCPNCKQSIPEDSKFCKYCGARIAQDRQQEPEEKKEPGDSMLEARQRLIDDFEYEKASASAKEPGYWAPKTRAGNEESAIASLKRVFIRMLQIAGFLIFFGPFVRIAFFGGISISGFEFATTYSPRELLEFGSDPVNIFLILSLLAGGLNILLSFADGSPDGVKIVSGNSLLALAGLILFRVTFSFYYEMSEYDMALIQMDWGWWAAIIMYAAAWAIRFIPDGTQYD